MRRTPGEIIRTTRRGVTIRYSPSQGGSRNYTVVCPHGHVTGARTQADANEAARDPDDWCYECRSQNA